MSVESDTMRYYAELDREERREAAIESRAKDEVEEIDGCVYDWLTKRFGENTAIALTDPDGYTDAEILESIHEARAHFFKWRDAQAERRAIEYLE